MTTVRVAAVQATYVLMNRDATIDRVAELTAAAAADGAELVVFPEAFVPGTPIWIDTQPIWDGDAEWFRLLAENAVAIPGPATDRLGAIAREHGVWLAIGVQEKEPHGGTIYNTFLYLSPDGASRTSIASSCPRARSGPSGAWATAPRCGSSKRRLGASAG